MAGQVRKKNRRHASEYEQVEKCRTNDPHINFQLYFETISP